MQSASQPQSYVSVLSDNVASLKKALQAAYETIALQNIRIQEIEKDVVMCNKKEARCTLPCKAFA